MLKLYKNIKQRRMELGLTQLQLAKKMGYSDKTMISKIENGLVDLSISKVVEFAEVLDTEPRLLMGWTEEEPAGNDSKQAQLMGLLNKLPQDDQAQLLKIAKAFLPEE